MTVLERHVFLDINDMAIPDVNQGEAATLSDTARNGPWTSAT